VGFSPVCFPKAKGGGAAFFFVSKGGGCKEDESLGFLPFRRLQGDEGFLGLGFFFCWLPFPL
jgi:hypothetical protein